VKPYWYYRSGFGSNYPDQWLAIFAAEERKNGNELFKAWRKGDAFTDEQQQWLNNYWQGITGDSQSNYALWRVLKQKEASKEKLREAWQKVWLREITAWDKSKRKEISTGAWKSGCDDEKGVSEGVAPVTGISGGHKYEETIRPTIGKIPPMPKADLLLIVAERLGMDLETVTERFNREWKNKSRNLFHHHGGGVWSTVHSEFTGRGKLTAVQLDELREKAKESRRRGKERTERQEQFWALFGTLPKCEPNHDDHAACEVWKHVQASPERVAVLEDIQSHATPKVREMSPWDYCYYLQRNLNNFIRDDLFLPYFKMGKHRQGKNWYPVELLRSAPKMTAGEFRQRCEDNDFFAQDLTHIVKLAEDNGDVSVYRYEGVIEGAGVIEERERAKREAEEAKDRERVEKEERKRIENEKGAFKIAFDKMVDDLNSWYDRALAEKENQDRQARAQAAIQKEIVERKRQWEERNRQAAIMIERERPLIAADLERLKQIRAEIMTTLVDLDSLSIAETNQFIADRWNCRKGAAVTIVAAAIREGVLMELRDDVFETIHNDDGYREGILPHDILVGYVGRSKYVDEETLNEQRWQEFLRQDLEEEQAA
jgi:hypothetical protein